MADDSNGGLQSWIGTLTNAFGTIYTTVNPPTPPRVVAGQGIPSSPASLRPVQQTGIGTIVVIALAALVVWLGLRK